MSNSALAHTLWADIARMVPLECEVSHLTEGDFVETTDESGLPCRRAKHHFVAGTLTAEEEQWGWRFRHPGFEGGSIFVHALNLDTTPSYSRIAFR